MRFFMTATRAAFVFVLVLASTACATMNVSSHIARGRDFTQYRTWDWGPQDALPTGDPRLDRDPFFQDHMEGAVEKQMALKGFSRAGAGSQPDLQVHYHAVIDTRLDIDRVDRDFGYCFDETCQARLVEYEAGTLILDVVETASNRVVWRGWAQNAIGPALENQDRLAALIDEAVAKMLARLPRTL
jgi:hypothetical protein